MLHRSQELSHLREHRQFKIKPWITPGVGKSHIAQALAHLAIRAGAEARFTKTSRALADLAGGHADGTWTRRLRELARPAVLVLDDFAMRELTPAQADDLYDYADSVIMPTLSRVPVV
jgi:DNA replication protein DnaC